MDIVKVLSQELNITENQVNTVIELLEEGNTIPFIARYRKEAHGSLNDELLREFYDRYQYLLNFEARRKTIEASIEEQGKLTDEIKDKLNSAKTLAELEDIYRPYKPKKKTRASIAREKGLEPLANYILEQKDSIDTLIEYAETFVNEEKKVKSKDEAILGAKDIIAEIIGDNDEYRKHIRLVNFNCGIVSTKGVKNTELTTFEMYNDYKEAINKIVAHRILAINRGEANKALKVELITPDVENIDYINQQIIVKNSPFSSLLKEVTEDAYFRLIKPSIDNEIRSDLTSMAEEASIKVFRMNLNELLLEAPSKDHVILGFDPAFRTGCKLAVINTIGDVLWTGVVYPTQPTNEEKIKRAKDTILALIDKFKIDLISLGNGTASRESEAFLRDVLNQKDHVTYVVTNEAGASVYSASKLGTEEFPDFDVALRSAVSLARRVQDPLAELVKIEPKAIGVGQYQHDMNQKRLGEALGGTVEDVVNLVGVDLNHASKSLLTYVSGINETIAKNIIEYRAKNGKFKSRKELLKVAKLGNKAFEQCAGFLRIPDEYPLDNTGVHPESYQAALLLLKELSLDLKDINTDEFTNTLENIKSLEELSNKLNVGVPTLQDIISELKKPGRDIRDLKKKANLRHDITDIKDLKEGMVLEGTVRNIMDFGVFVDIGVHQDGLVHISEISNKYIKHPLDVLKIGQIVKVKIIQVDVTKKRIGLSIKKVTE